MNSSKNRNRALTNAALAFPALVIGQCSAFYVLPFLVPLITGAAVALYGVVLSALLLPQLWSKQEGVWKLVIGLVALTWLGWVFVPTKEFAVQVRFWLERPKYEQVVAQIARGEQPSCLRTNECLVVGNEAPYVVFPFPGFLSGWIGVVHVPELDQVPDSERLKSVASDPGCDLNAIAPHYYVCGFY